MLRDIDPFLLEHFTKGNKHKGKGNRYDWLYMQAVQKVIEHRDNCLLEYFINKLYEKSIRHLPLIRRVGKLAIAIRQAGRSAENVLP